MPIAKVQLPDGRIAKFEVAEGTTPQEVEAFAAQQVQQLKQPSFAKRAAQKTGEFLGELGPGLGELGAGAFQLGAELVGREDIAGRVGEQITREREQLTGAQKAGRIAGQIIPLAGAGVATGARTAAALGGGATAKAAGAGVAGGVAGAELGAVSPTQEGTLPVRAREIGQSAALGTLGGAVLSGAGQAIGAGAKGIKRLFTAASPEDIIAKRLPAGQTADLLDQLKTASPDSPIALPDVAGDEVRGLTRAVGKLSGAKDIVTDALEGRSTKAVERVSNQLAKDISNADSYFGSLDDIAKARSELAAPLYKKAFAKGTKLDINKNKELFEKIAPDLKDARRIFRLGDEIADNSIIMLDSAKKSLDDKIGVAIRQGERQQAKILGDIKRELVGKIDELNPDYKKARQVFSDFASIQNAQEQGLQFSKLRPEELKRLVKDLSVSEKEAFRIGVRENLQKVVANTAEGADPAKRIFGNSFKRKQIEAIFPSKEKFKGFEKRMIEEVNAADTKFRVLGGSRTDINLADEEAFLGKLAQTGGAVATGGKLPIIGAAISSIKNKFGGISEKNAKALANILVKKQNSISALENILIKEQNQVQKRLISEYINSVRPELLTTQTIQTQTDN
jgi:hypothetical protein